MICSSYTGTRLLLFLSLLIAMPATAIGQGSDPAPDQIQHRIVLRLHPETGAFAVEQRFPARPDAMVLHFPPWVEEVKALSGGKRLVMGAERQLPPAASLANREITLILRGTVPKLATEIDRGSLSQATSSPEGSYLPADSGWMVPTAIDGDRYRLTVQVPVPYRAVATGRLTREEIDDESYRAVFVSEGPSEPPAVFAGLYKVAERIEDNLRLRTYFHPESASLAAEYLEASASFIRSYERQIGAYPYAGFSVVSSPMPVGLGFPGLTYVSRRILPLPFMQRRSLAHEILHNWWGSGVRVDYAEGNWAEGLTTYLADHALALETGEAAAREMRLNWLRDLTALPDSRTIPVIDFVGKTHDPSQVIGYGKVALIFHMLRDEIGDAAFRDGLRKFWISQKFKVAAWSDLQSAFEEAADRKLGWFFEQWLEQAGQPRISLADASVRKEAGGHQISLTIKQDSPPFRLSVPVVVETAQGETAFVAVLESDEQTYRFSMEERPRVLRVDPDFDLVRLLLPNESPPIFRDVTLSERAVVVFASEDSAFRDVGRDLARRLLQRTFETTQLDAVAETDRPLIVIGKTQEVAAIRTGSPLHPMESLGDEGSARAWVEKSDSTTPRLFISADSADALRQALGPLPHYRNRSFVVFEGRKAVRNGNWESGASPLTRRFD